ncbi:glycosyltransferase [Glutamicibacter sp. JC586]|uniref:glycosyltransferase n=1 Tax=Glutamicibacter sp. JC586 TaxID=2590552 RepID=UPI0013598D3B|nr:glycosyltransferase [Glutamicibacter sp. JC586]
MSLPSDELDAYMVTWKLEREFGGMTTVCTQRAGLFAQRYGRSFIVTFNNDPQLPETVEYLIQRGKLDPKVQVLNPYFYLAQHEIAPQDVVPARKAEPAEQNFALQRTEYYPDEPHLALSQRSTAGPDHATTQTRFLRKDGSTFLIDTRFADTAGKNRRIIEVLDRDGKIAARFASAPAFYRHWLNQLVDREKTLVVVDSKFTAAKLGNWKTSIVPKLYAFHSVHVAKGESLITGKLSEPHAPVIEQRHNWDGFVFLTEAQRHSYNRRFGDEQNTFVIPNPIKTSALDDLAGGPDAPARQPNQLIAAGSLTTNKNVAAAIKVVAELVKRGLNPVLNVLGDGSQRKNLEELTDELGVGDAVIFHGFSDQLPQLFASSTIQLFTSSNEGQALVLLEAQSQGCIPVSFDINFGPSDSIENGVNGFLVARGDIQAMADRTEQIMRDPQLAARLSANAKDFAHQYTARDVLSQWEETMNITAKLKQLGPRAQLPEFSAQLKSVEFLDHGALSIEVNHGAQVPRGAKFELVILDRRDQREVKVYPASEVAGPRALFAIDQAGVHAARGEQNPTDVFLRFSVAGSLGMKRLGVENSRVLPYFTSHNNLSFKPEQ